MKQGAEAELSAVTLQGMLQLETVEAIPESVRADGDNNTASPRDAMTRRR